MASWMVQDRQVPELAVGDVLGQRALRASCWSIGRTGDPDGVTELPDLDPTGSSPVRYRVSGRVEWAREPSSLLLRAGDFLVLCEPNTFREVRYTVRPRFRRKEVSAMQPYSPAFTVPEVGSQAAVVCTLHVMADHETEDFGFPDLRQDWTVRGIRLERSARGSGRGDEFVRGAVVAVDDIAQMDALGDEPEGECITYLLDAVPGTH